jgi:tetratricopeptide (TPR) repeat protein
MRAELHYEASRYSEALDDAQRALAMPASAPTTRKCFRVASDVYEQKGMYSEAIQCLQQWAARDKSFETKISKEIQRLQSAIR